jgi:hypothetical protein
MPRTWSALLTIAVLLAGCRNPVSPGTHLRPDGFAIVHDGVELVRQEAGTVTGALQLVPGGQLGPVTVQFHEGGAVTTPGADYFLEIEIADAGIASFSHTTPGSYTGTFNGLAAGTTTLRVRLMHGRVGSPFAHHDFESRPVPVEVAGG